MNDIITGGDVEQRHWSGIPMQCTSDEMAVGIEGWHNALWNCVERLESLGERPTTEGASPAQRVARTEPRRVWETMLWVMVADELQRYKAANPNNRFVGSVLAAFCGTAFETDGMPRDGDILDSARTREADALLDLLCILDLA